MSKQRMVNTRFWTDGYILRLTKEEKLIFIYLLTNQRSELCGAYELPLDVVSFETGVDKESVSKALKSFARDSKVILDGDWVYLVNFAKHQSVNPNVQKGIDRSLADLPHTLAKKIKAFESLPNHSESLPNHYPLKPKLKPELKPELELELEPKIISTTDEPWREGVNQVFKVFYETVNPQINFGRKPWREAAKELVERYGAEETVALAKLAVSIQGQPFSPVITNPYQLKEKLSALQIFTVKLNQPKKGAIQSL
jgi:hypothetical protein